MLRCHCRDEEECHGDILIELAEKKEPRDHEPKDTPNEGPLVTQVPESLREVDDYVGDHGTGGITEVPPGDFAGLTVRSEGRRRPPGRGGPRLAEYLGSAKPFADGGALCSPGRWAPEKRNTEDKGLYALRDILFSHFGAAARSAGCDNALDYTLKLSAGRFTECPFDNGVLEEARAAIAKYLGLDPTSTQAAPGQVLRFDLIKALLAKAGDPDANFFGELRHGVPLGVDMEMPRTPEVFEEKVKWRLEETDGPGEPERQNYVTLEEHLADVRALFAEEAGHGWI